MERINAYTAPTKDGGVSVDIEGMMVDLITIIKAGGVAKEDFLKFAGQVFDDCEVKVKIPNRARN